MASVLRPWPQDHPCPRRQLRRHVDHRFAVGDEPLRQMPADAVAALDRPDAIRPPPARGQQRPIAVPVSAEPSAAEHPLVLVEDLDRR